MRKVRRSITFSFSTSSSGRLRLNPADGWKNCPPGSSPYPKQAPLHLTGNGSDRNSAHECVIRQYAKSKLVCQLFRSSRCPLMLAELVNRTVGSSRKGHSDQCMLPRRKKILPITRPARAQPHWTNDAEPRPGYISTRLAIESTPGVVLTAPSVPRLRTGPN
jgi:hypothetical protein